uniref:PDCD2_C domain-containing protein n=1 Tax=Steinernema glaseri TaxID=37863 RepID=A0A1I7Z3C9_9BILA
MTAANPDESSWGCFCDEGDLPCLGDEFSVNWMRDSEQNEANKETLATQFHATKTATKQSHVSKYGDFDFLQEAVADFQGDQQCEAEESEAPTSMWPVQEIPVRVLEKKIRRAASEGEREALRKELHNLKEKRERVANLYRSIASRVLLPGLVAEVVSVRPRTIAQPKCHDAVVKFFDQHCLSFSQNPFAFHHAFILANLCELRANAAPIIDAISAECQRVRVQRVI